jgi:general secretion pathway protein G
MVRTTQAPRTCAGFTLIELLVVLALMALLLSTVAPSYFSTVNKADEAVLRKNLHVVRDAIDKFYADRERYPESLQELVEQRYLRAVPADPVADPPGAWQVIAPPNGQPGKVFDVRSAAQGQGRDGTRYSTW